MAVLGFQRKNIVIRLKLENLMKIVMKIAQFNQKVIYFSKGLSA